MSLERKRGYRNTSLEKAFGVIDLFGQNTSALSLTEIARQVGSSPSSLYPLLGTLLELGYLERDASTKKYFLGVRFLEKGYYVHVRLDIRNRASIYLDELRNQLQENVHMAVLDGHEIVYLDKRETMPNLPIESRIGQRAPAYSTALGKVLLAFTSQEDLDLAICSTSFKPLTKNTIFDKNEFRANLATIRRQGYGVDDGEFQEEGLCFAAPIYDFRKQVVAAVSVSMRRESITTGRRQEIIEAVCSTGLKISERLGYISISENPYG